MILAVTSLSAQGQSLIAQSAGPSPPSSSAAPSVNTLGSGPVLTPQQSAADRIGPEPKPNWQIQPRITVGETFTDNVNPASGIKQADQITELSPGIRLEGNTARLKAYADYQATAYYYVRGSYSGSTKNALNSFGTFEAIEKLFYLDFSGVISQQSISAFGPQVASNAILDANRTETSSYRISPYLRGKLGNVADYELRYGGTWTSSKSALVSSTTLRDWSAKVKNSVTKSRFGWSVDASEQSTAYGNGNKSSSDRLRVLLSYQFFPDIKLSASVGQESNDYRTTNRETQATSGYGVDWTPTERTLASAFFEKRFFGEARNYSFSHRTPLMAFKYSDTSEVSFVPNQFSTVGLGTTYDLLYTQLASAIPDPILRAQQVSNVLAQTGLSPNTQVTSSFLSSRVSVQKRQEFTMVLNGARNTVSGSLVRSVQNVQSIAAAATGAGDFSTSSTIAQKGVSGSWAYRLTPLASLTTTVSQQESTGTGAATLSSRQKAMNLTYTTRVAAQTNLSLGVRSSAFSSNTSAYRENAVLATLVARF